MGGVFMRKGFAFLLTAFMMVSMLPVSQALAEQVSGINISSPTPPGTVHTNVSSQNGNGGTAIIDLVPIGNKLADLDWGMNAYYPVNSFSGSVQWDDGTSSPINANYGIFNATRHPQDSVQHRYSSTGVKEVWFSGGGYMEYNTLYYTVVPFADSDVIN